MNGAINNVIMGVLAFICGTMAVWGQDSGAPGGGLSPPEPNVPGENQALERELWSLVEQLRCMRQEYYQARQLRTSKLEAVKKDSQKLQGELAELVLQEETADREMQEIQSDIAQLKQQQETYDSVQAKIVDQLAQLIPRVEGLVRGGIPYRIEERLARLREGEMPGGSEATMSMSEKLGNFWSFFQQEMRLARSGETYTDQIELSPGCLRHVRLFRVGHQILGYVTEDAAQSGIWMAQAAQPGWKHNLTGKEDAQVRRAVEILDRRQAPQLVQLPLAVNQMPEHQENPLEEANE